MNKPGCTEEVNYPRWNFIRLYVEVSVLRLYVEVNFLRLHVEVELSQVGRSQVVRRRDFSLHDSEGSLIDIPVQWVGFSRKRFCWHKMVHRYDHLPWPQTARPPTSDGTTG